MKFNIEVFGAFKDYYKSGFIELEFENHVTIGQIKQAIIAQDSNNKNFIALVNSSVLANHNEILSDICLIESACELLILPPVSGGI